MGGLYTGLMLAETAEVLQTSTTLTGGASAQYVAASPSIRSGLMITADSAAANPIYLLLGTGTASATNFHICLAAGTAWDGTIGGVLWRGAVQGFSAAGNKVGVVEV
jgi:hypothetical protein